tara:strand:+ start:45353 stop:46705 length:1353 start_codon:yes stop_codon:yes gene_type:complete
MTESGRLAIRTDESDEPRGHMFYVAYHAKPKSGNKDSQTRPILFMWGGGPGGEAKNLHLKFIGPRIFENEQLVDNQDTLLTEADLVFVDAVGTGFSRPAKPEYAAQFYTMGGDLAATTEFIRSYLAIHGQIQRSIYVGGQSLGTWRAAGVGEKLAEAGYNLKGIVIISGQVPGAEISFAFDDAMYIPARTRSAIFFKKLSPELLADPDKTIKQVEKWTRDVYWSALEKKDSLSHEEREQIARQLARYTGVDEDFIDRKALTMTTTVYRKTLLGSDPESVLSISDLTRSGLGSYSFAQKAAYGAYFRDELGYNTALPYISSGDSGIEHSFFPSTAVDPHQATDWQWDIPEMTSEELKRLENGYAPPNAPHWIQNALKRNPGTRVFIAAGKLDAMVSCMGNAIMIDNLGSALANRYTNKCYFGGHSIYLDRPDTRIALTNDLKAFISAGLER